MSRRGIAGLKSTHAYTSHTTIGNITKTRTQYAFEVTWYQTRVNLDGLLNAVVGSFTSVLGSLLFLMKMCHHQHHIIWLCGEFESHYLAEIEYWSSTLWWMDRERFCQTSWNIFAIFFDKYKVVKVKSQNLLGHICYEVVAMINACRHPSFELTLTLCHL